MVRVVCTRFPSRYRDEPARHRRQHVGIDDRTCETNDR
jgi:hypothetical protein